MLPIDDTIKNKVLELFLCSDDKRIKTISEMTNISEVSVSTIIENYFKQRLIFERPKHLLYHSKINYHD